MERPVPVGFQTRVIEPIYTNFYICADPVGTFLYNLLSPLSLHVMFPQCSGFCICHILINKSYLLSLLLSLHTPLADETCVHRIQSYVRCVDMCWNLRHFYASSTVTFCLLVLHHQLCALIVFAKTVVSSLSVGSLQGSFYMGCLLSDSELHLPFQPPNSCSDAAMWIHLGILPTSGRHASTKLLQHWFQNRSILPSDYDEVLHTKQEE